MMLQLCWRNIWRNPRRTLVILIAIVIGVWSMVFLGAIMRGMISGMITNGVSTLTGHIQIHHKGYRDDPAIENSIVQPASLETVLQNTLPQHARWAKRVRVNAIANNARHSSGVTLVGIEPQTEARLSFIGSALTQGRYLQPGEDPGILIGEALARQFETGLGKKLILMSQDLSGDIASHAFRVVGIFRAEMQNTEKAYVFAALATARDMLGLEERISEVAIVLNDHRSAHATAETLKAQLPSQAFEVHTWRQLLPMLDAYLRLFDGFIFIWYLVVFVAMGFGITNTTLMAVFERMREFGLLKSLGMKPWGIIQTVLTESALLLLLGIAVGNLLAFMCVSALATHGIDLSAFAAGAEYAGITRIIFPDLRFMDWLTANLVVAILGMAVSLYPAVKAARFSPVEALAHV